MYDFKQDKMNTEHAAEYMSLSKKTLSMWRCQSKGPKFIKLGSRVFYRKSDLDAFIEANSGYISTSQTRTRKKV